MIIPPELRDILAADSNILSGAARFKGTRIPVQALIDTLDRGTVEDFLEGWPDVSREQAEAVIRWEQTLARKVFGLEMAG